MHFRRLALRARAVRHDLGARAGRPLRAAAPRAGLAAALAALLLLPAAPALSQGERPSEGPRSSGLVVKVDIEERIEGEPSSHAVTSYHTRQRLRASGLRAWSAQPIPIDRQEREKRAEEAREKGVDPRPLLDDLQPEPALIIRGTSSVDYDRDSEFYGASIAHIYRSSVRLEIQTPDGETLATIEDGEEWGRGEKRQARNDALRRIALFTAAAVLDAEPIQEQLTDEGKAEARRFINRINSQRRRSGG